MLSDHPRPTNTVYRHWVRLITLDTPKNFQDLCLVYLGCVCPAQAYFSSPVDELFPYSSEKG